MLRTCLLWLSIATAAFAQRKPVTLDALQAWRSHAAAPFRLNPVWAPSSAAFAYRNGKNVMLYTVPAHGEAPASDARAILDLEQLESAAARPPAPQREFWENRRVTESEIQWFPSERELLVSAGGDLFRVDLNGQWKQITRTPVAERDPKLSPDGRRVAFLRDWDLYTLDLATGRETRLTAGGSDTLRNGAPDWVYPEELNLDSAYWWAPDSSAIAYLQFDTAVEPLYPHADLRSEKPVEEPQRYPKAGDNNARIKLGVVAATGGPTRWFELGDTVREFLIARAGWTPDSSRLWTVRMNRVQNRLDFLVFDKITGKVSAAYTERDPYWINIEGTPIFLQDGSGFVWTSERTGLRQVYFFKFDGSAPRQITFDTNPVVEVVCFSSASLSGYAIAANPSSGTRELTRFSLAGSQNFSTDHSPIPDRIPGTHRVSMSPGCRYYADTFSNTTSPPETTLRDSKGKMIAVLGPADRSALNEFEILPAEFVTFKAPDGTDLRGRLIKPRGFDPQKKYPAIVDVYGGPHEQIVRDAWSGMSIDQVFAHAGYVVWQMDNRGSYGRGHAFETPLFRQLGETERADQLAGLDYLISLGFVDRDRIGVHGWSYGGFMTLNLLLNAPDRIRAGFAGAPVTDWRNYDSIYTERYMGLPSENAGGYESTALTRKAARLKGALMIAHNIEDDNVLFQNTVQMITALENAGKQFELSLYTQKGHGVGGLARQQMERAMFDFFERTLKPPALDRDPAR